MARSLVRVLIALHLLTLGKPINKSFWNLRIGLGRKMKERAEGQFFLQMLRKQTIFFETSLSEYAINYTSGQQYPFDFAVNDTEKPTKINITFDPTGDSAVNLITVIMRRNNESSAFYFDSNICLGRGNNNSAIMYLKKLIKVPVIPLNFSDEINGTEFESCQPDETFPSTPFDVATEAAGDLWKLWLTVGVDDTGKEATLSLCMYGLKRSWSAHLLQERYFPFETRTSVFSYSLKDAEEPTEANITLHLGNESEPKDNIKIRIIMKKESDEKAFSFNFMPLTVKNTFELVNAFEISTSFENTTCGGDYPSWTCRCGVDINKNESENCIWYREDGGMGGDGHSPEETDDDVQASGWDVLPTTAADDESASPTDSSIVSAAYTTDPVAKPARCLCPCGPETPSGEPPTLASVTPKEREVDLQNMVAEMAVDRKTLSSYIRRKTSAKDFRPSATTVGGLGVAFLVIPFSILLIMDLTTLIGYLLS